VIQKTLKKGGNMDRRLWLASALRQMRDRGLGNEDGDVARFNLFEES